MPPLTSFPKIPNDNHSDPRFRSITGRMLDSIERVLDTLATFDAPETRYTAIADAVWARCAPLLCRQVRCRRARRCRRHPCVAPCPRHDRAVLR